MKILFILKSRDTDFGDCYSHSGGFSSGLNNSVIFIKKLLDELKIESKIVEVKDNNSIDKELTAYKPTICIIEALWVVPSKFDILKKLHPNVRFMVRLHSEIGFIATEGIAMEWIQEYTGKGITVTANSPRMKEILDRLIPYHITPYLPNYYPLSIGQVDPVTVGETINVGCFGAIRVLKNQLLQATAAIIYSIENGKILKFHVNSSRVENNSSPVLKNLRGLFKHYEDYGFELVEHGWKNHEDFLKLIGSMNVNLQTSFTETYNIVCADSLSQMTPVIGSSEIPFLPKEYAADPNDVNSIIKLITKVLDDPKIAAITSIRSLAEYNEHSRKAWKQFLHA